ncbi:MAG: hypothetical protein J7639_20080 [Paenibacillaceae bacterium]|nr:hypothetical protein [Paenibacillaceae bacterium]
MYNQSSFAGSGGASSRFGAQKKYEPVGFVQSVYQGKQSVINKWNNPASAQTATAASAHTASSSFASRPQGAASSASSSSMSGNSSYRPSGFVPSVTSAATAAHGAAQTGYRSTAATAGSMQSRNMGR